MMDGATAEFVFGVVIGGMVASVLGSFVIATYVFSSPWERHERTRD